MADRIRVRCMWLLTHRLLRRSVVVIQFASEQTEPLLEVQDSIIHKVAGPGFNQEGPLVRKIFCQPRRDDTAL